jgi:hypothetical protein
VTTKANANVSMGLACSRGEGGAPAEGDECAPVLVSTADGERGQGERVSSRVFKYYGPQKQDPPKIARSWASIANCRTASIEAQKSLLADEMPQQPAEVCVA